MSVIGKLEIKINVECPECNEDINLLSDTGLTDDGWLYDLVMPTDKPWAGACKDFSKEYLETFGEDYTCESCGKVIYIKEILY